MIKAYKYKLKPTAVQEIRLNQWIGTCRFVYNMCLAHKINLFRSYGKNISKYDLQKELTEVRKEYDWINDVPCASLADVTDRLDLAYRSFFKGNGFPKFAKKGFYNSVTFKESVSLHYESNQVKIPKIGKILFFNSRPIPSEIKRAIIKKVFNGWFIILLCEEDIKPLPLSNSTIGIDLGISNYLATSTGKIITNPKHILKYGTKLKKQQRSLARKQKGSNNRKKSIRQLQITYSKLRNVRTDFLQKLSTKIINENQVVVVENLQVKNMVKNHSLAKSISDASWGAFMEMLKYKSTFYSRQFIKVNPYNTSKNCSNCGSINEELTLSVREWSCDNCGTEHNRDVNAAINILNLGLHKLKEARHAFSTCGDMEVNKFPAQESTFGNVDEGSPGQEDMG